MRRLLLICLSALLFVTTWAYDFEIDGVYCSIIESSYNNNVGVVGLCYLDEANSAAYSGDVVIPSSVLYNGREFTVTSIQAGALQNCSSLESVTLSTSLTSIASYMFDGCTSLKKLYCRMALQN